MKWEHRQLWIIQCINDVLYEIKIENCVKDKSNFFIKQKIAFLSWTKIYFFLGDIFF